MNAVRMVMAAVLGLCAVFMVGNVIFYIYEMANYPSYSYDGSVDPRAKYHWNISLATWIVYFLMGIVMLAAAVMLPGWWRKGLAAWGMFTCLVMFVMGFILSNRASFNELGLVWIVAGLWLAFLFAAMAVAAFLAKPKPANSLATSVTAP